MREPPDLFDPPVVFQLYAWTAATLGTFVVGWGPLMMQGVDLPQIPFARQAAFRVMGGAVIAAACSAAGLSRIGDTQGLRRALAWFAAGHIVFWLVLFIQWWAILEHQMPPALVSLPLGVGLLLLYCAFPDPIVHRVRRYVPVLFAPPPLPGGRGALRSRHEEQVRRMARQEERARLARDLHDAVKQQLFVVQTAAATAEARFESDPAGTLRAVADVRAAAREAITEMEVMLEQLRAEPLEANGLVEALRKQVEAVGYRSGAKATFELGPTPPSALLAPGAHQAVFRVAQEALSNVARHARASKVTVELGGGPDAIELVVRDNGRGFDPNAAPRGLGRASMPDRMAEIGGSVEVVSRPGQGTTVSCRVPTALESPGDYRSAAISRGLLWIGHTITAQFTFQGIFGDPLTAVVNVVLAILFLRALVTWRRVRALAGAAA